MSSEYDRRAAVVESLRAGHSAKEIIEWFKYPKTMVYELAKAYESATEKEIFTPERKAHKKRADTIRTPEFVQGVAKVVKEDPSKSMGKIAAEVGASRRTVERVVKDDLNLKSYVLARRHLLTEDQKERRMLRAAALINDLKHVSAGMLRFFSDEKNFVQDMKNNRQNDRWLAESPDEVPVVMHSKYPAHVMVLGVISNEGDIMEPVFIPDGLRLNAKEYVGLLEQHVKPWMDTVANGRPYVFQQDSAPAHKARTTQAWLFANVPYHWSPDLWPPSSPDCNPLDYFVWGVLEREVNRSPHNSKDSLKAAIRDAVDGIDRDAVVRACSSFRSRLEGVVAAHGGHIE